MLQKIRELLKEKGQGIVEYAMILGFVAVVAIGLLGSDGLKKQVSTALTNITSQFTTLNKEYDDNKDS